MNRFSRILTQDDRQMYTGHVTGMVLVGIRKVIRGPYRSMIHVWVPHGKFYTATRRVCSTPCPPGVFKMHHIIQTSIGNNIKDTR